MNKQYLYFTCVTAHNLCSALNAAKYTHPTMEVISVTYNEAAREFVAFVTVDKVSLEKQEHERQL